MHKQHCETCDKAFWPRQSGGRSQVFCSAPCRLEGVARRRQLRRVTERNSRRTAALLAAQNGTGGTRCPGCDTMFVPPRSDGQYCSRKCRERVWRRRRRRANPQQTTCPSCGTMFVPLRSTGRYCSPKCRQRAYDQRQRQRANPQTQGADEGQGTDEARTPQRAITDDTSTPWQARNCAADRLNCRGRGSLARGATALATPSEGSSRACWHRS